MVSVDEHDNIDNAAHAGFKMTHAVRSPIDILCNAKTTNLGVTLDYGAVDDA
jgi:hypothetical protein